MFSALKTDFDFTRHRNNNNNISYATFPANGRCRAYFYPDARAYLHFRSVSR